MQLSSFSATTLSFTRFFDNLGTLFKVPVQFSRSVVFWSSLRLTSIESVMPSSHLILCRPLLLLPPIPPSIRVFSNESTLRMLGTIIILLTSIFNLHADYRYFFETACFQKGIHVCLLMSLTNHTA